MSGDTYWCNHCESEQPADGFSCERCERLAEEHERDNARAAIKARGQVDKS